MTVPADLKYTTHDEWIRVEGDIAIIGITDHAQDALGELVNVELPEVGEEFEAGGELGEVESTKAVAEVYTAVGGEVVEVNEALEDEPELINSDPYGAGWLVKIRIDGGLPDGLLDAAAYSAKLAG